MSRAVIFSITSHQNSHSMLEFVNALADRGEDVTFYVPGYPSATAPVKGVTLRLYENSALLSLENKMTLGLQLIQTSQRVLPAVLRDLSEERPDYIVFDSRCVWGWYAARILKIPAVSLFTAPVINREVLIRSGKLPGELSGFWRHLNEMSQYRKIASELEETYKMAGPSISTVLYNKGDLNLVQTIDILQPWASSLDDHYRFIGVHEEMLPQTPARWVIAPDAADIADLIAQAFADVAQKAPDLMDATCWLVTHGEMSAVHQAILDRRLLIMVPKSIEQDILAEHLHQMGVGIRLPKGTFHYLEAQLRASKLASADEAQRSLEAIRIRVQEVDSIEMMLDSLSEFKGMLGLVGSSV